MGRWRGRGWSQGVVGRVDEWEEGTGRGAGEWEMGREEM